MPKPSGTNSSSIVDDKIYLVGKNLDNLLIYDDLRDKYLIHSHEFAKNKSKVILGKWIIIQEENHIFEIVGDELKMHATSSI